MNDNTAQSPNRYWMKGALIDMVSSLYQLQKVDINSEHFNPHVVPSMSNEAINNWLHEHLVIPSFPSQRLRTHFQHKSRTCSTEIYYQLIRSFQHLTKIVAKSIGVFTSDLNDAVFQEQVDFLKVAEKVPTNKALRYLKELYHLFFPKTKPEWFQLRKESRNIGEINHPTIDSHLSSLKRLSKKTRIERKRAYYRFLSWVCSVYTEFREFEPCSVPLHKVRNDHLIEFSAHLKQRVLRGELEASHANYIQTYIINLFQSLFQERRLMMTDITEGVRKIKYEKYLYRDIPTDEEISRLLIAIDRFAPHPKLFRLAFECMLHLGLRKNEVAALRWEDFDVRSSTLKIVGKGNKVVLRPLSKQILSTFKDLAEPNTNGYLFSENPKTFADYLYIYFRIFSKMAGWHYPGGLHLLRHTFLTKLSRKKECTPPVLMYWGRFSKSETASIYIHRSEDELVTAMKKFNILQAPEVFQNMNITVINN